MYEAHWKLRVRPFEPGFRAEYYYPSELHQTAWLKLSYAIENRRSIAVLGGYSGMGKSFILHQLRSRLPEFVGPVIQVSYPAMSADDFIRYVAGRFAGDQRDKIATTADAVELIEQRLTNVVADGGHALLIIEEAECLEEYGILDSLRWLLNLGITEATSESALTVVLSGHPTLIGQLERYHRSINEPPSGACSKTSTSKKPTLTSVIVFDKRADKSKPCSKPTRSTRSITSAKESHARSTPLRTLL